MTTITVQLPDDVAEQLAAAATAAGVSVNVAMVQAAQEWIHANAQRARERARVQAVLADDPHLRALLGDD
ncbi:ribbon-helix-helix protein, CopG family [Nocardia salmonicida]|uniref:ribbon-helix-helix protein, CopG family n=1 Tax=Nocardia salmonicida TaxID=53431 RepID=UPI0007A4D6BB|nr:ribbon-helix-helix protein, CopG family [Nocardia salmonicida]